MPTLTVENVPPDLYDDLRRRADQQRRSLPDEAIHLLRLALQRATQPPPRRPDFVEAMEVLPPYDLPRSSVPVVVQAIPGEPRRPDPPLIDDVAPS